MFWLCGPSTHLRWHFISEFLFHFWDLHAPLYYYLEGYEEHFSLVFGFLRIAFLYHFWLSARKTSGNLENVSCHHISSLHRDWSAAKGCPSVPLYHASTRQTGFSRPPIFSLLTLTTWFFANIRCTPFSVIRRTTSFVRLWTIRPPPCA